MDKTLEQLKIEAIHLMDAKYNQSYNFFNKLN
jgi:hypothetical protein